MMTGKMPEHSRTTLQMLTELIAINIDRCIKYKEMQGTWETYNSFFKDVASELKILSDNVGVISNAMRNAKDLNEKNDLTQHTNAQKTRLLEIINSLKD
jgi:hypothetical protein